MLCQLEVPDEAVLSAWEQCTGLFCLNAAPARPIAVDADLTVVNRHELDALVRRDGLVALTLGAEGAVLLDDGEEIARATPPAVEAVDGTAAGDAFTACLLVSLLEGRGEEEALDPGVRRRRARRVPLRRAAVAADGGRGGRDPRRLTGRSRREYGLVVCGEARHTHSNDRFVDRGRALELYERRSFATSALLVTAGPVGALDQDVLDTARQWKSAGAVPSSDEFSEMTRKSTSRLGVVAARVPGEHGTREGEPPYGTCAD